MVDTRNLDPSMSGAFEKFSQAFPEVRPTSGFRDPFNNRRVGGASGSAHLDGRALDFSVRGLPDERKREAINWWRERGATGLGYYPDSDSIHVDNRPGAPRAWGPNYSYTSLPDTPPWFQEVAGAHRGGGTREQSGIPTPAPRPVERKELPPINEAVLQTEYLLHKVKNTVNTLAEKKIAAEYEAFKKNAAKPAATPAPSALSQLMGPQEALGAEAGRMIAGPPAPPSAPSPFAGQFDMPAPQQAPAGLKEGLERTGRAMLPGMAETAARGVAQGFTGNLADEMSAAAAASPFARPNTGSKLPNLGAVDVITGLINMGLEQVAPGIFGDRAGRLYEVKLKEERQRDADASSANPITSIVGNVAGAIANPVSRAIAPTLNQGLGTALKTGAQAGAITGAIYGAGGGEGAADRLGDAALGAAVGVPLGALGGAAGRYMAGASGAPPVAGAGPTGADVAAAGGRLGVEIPKAVASDSMAVQRAGAAVRNVPFAGDPLVKASERAMSQLGTAADDVARGFGGSDAAQSGANVRDAISVGWKGRVNNVTEKLYDAVDQKVNPNATTKLTNTQGVVAQILSSRQAARLQNATGGAVDAVENAIKDPAGLTYEGVKRLRSEIGRLIDSPNLTAADIPQSELRQVYGALTKDLGDTVQNAGGTAARSAWERANKFAAAAAKRKEELQKIVGAENDEGVLNRLTLAASTKGSANVYLLRKAKSAIGPDTWDEVAGTLVSRMGRDKQGQFSGQRFLTDYGNLSDEAKNLLFKGTGRADLGRALDDIATVSSRFKDLQKFSNPSGTSQNVAGGSMLAGMAVDPVTTIGTIIGARGLASVLASPASASSMARWAKVYSAAVTNPTAASYAALDRASRNFAATIGERSGVQTTAQELMRLIQGGLPSRAGDNERKPNAR
jgi:hypothetical protein